MPRPLRVAVVGGGCAAMAAAFELSKPGRGGPRCEVTVYQMGHRLGGKGASGRGASGRIEEHGLHLWMGYYENAFRLMRECYAELGRDPARCPIASWTDAFSPANLNAVTDWSPASGRWLPWVVDFPASPGLPGDPRERLLTVPEYLSRLASLGKALLATLVTGQSNGAARASPTDVASPEALVAAAARLAKYGAAIGLGALVEAMGLLESALARLPLLPQSPLSGLVDAVASAARAGLEAMMERDEVRRLWEILDLILATVRGAIRFRLAFDPRGFDAIDDYDSREWLRANGASQASVNSAFLRGLYDLAFAYQHGDPSRPAIAAGAALRGSMRAFFTYRGAFFWRMNAGMGDAVFAPLYEVLRRRGVKFEFFHKLTNVQVTSGGQRHVTALSFDVQARVKRGKEYAPLVSVKGLPCWPSEPLFEQLVDGKRLEGEGRDFESQWDQRRAVEKTLRVSEDFDIVVLGVPVAVLPYVCGELIEADARFADMVRHVTTVPTQAFQLWLRRSGKELGWQEPVNVSGFVEPFDTWADMSHLAPREAWKSAPRSIAYFCNAMPEEASAPARFASTEEAAAFVLEKREEVRRNAAAFMNRDLHHLWQNVHSGPGAFDWNALHTDGRAVGGEADLASQYLTANVRPSDRYSQTLPGSTRHRISPLDRTFDNLTFAGDWTASGLNTGCVEGATMSGLLAAHAITLHPPLSEIVGYDHP
jgi:uncharacterized protein with NAD-binding domain and iron-sulfur cluster